jgi:hypothetical protein
VRYAADTLNGCLVETMAGFRHQSEAEDVLASIEGVDADDPGESSFMDPALAVGEWLRAQRIGALRVTSPHPALLDVEAPELLDALDKHPQVRDALAMSGLGTPLDPARLDAGIIRLGGPVGRPITQAASRAVYDWIPDADGLAYWSRLDASERCWAIYDHVPVTATVVELDPNDAEHRTAVRRVAARFEIQLPDDWE